MVKVVRGNTGSSKKITKKMKETSPTLAIAGERDIAMDFAGKVYEKFDQMIKSVVLFGSSARRISTGDSDIDVVVIIDDVAIAWDEELIAWYREELGKIISGNPYRKSLHVNTVKLSTWWQDMMRGDPVVINVLRYGEALIDYGGFFGPLQVLLKEGKIRPSPEAIYTLLQRSVGHLGRARQSMVAVLDGIYWCMTDAAHAALVAGDIMPASPEDIAEVLRAEFAKKGLMKRKFADWYEDVQGVAKKVLHGKLKRVSGKDLDEWFERSDLFMAEMARLVDVLVEKR